MELVALILAWLVALIRAATGVTFLAAPQPTADKWVGESGLAARYLVRAVGARDLVLGAGLAWALATDTGPAGWLLASVAADGFDAMTGSTMLTGRHRTRTLVAAGGFGVLGIAAFVLLMAT